MDNAKRLLILGSLEDMVKLTQLAVSRGIYTVVADGYDGEAKRYASASYTLDLNDDALLDEIIRTERIDVILTSFSDILFEIMVCASERNRLPCFCSVEKMRYLRDKILMKEMLEELGIPTACAQRIKDPDLHGSQIEISFPCVLKPSDGWGSKGLSIVHDMNELQERFESVARFSTSGHDAMLEEINTGYEQNVMAWIRNGEAHLLEFGDRETSEMTPDSLPHQSREIFPSTYYRELESTVKDYLLRIADYCEIAEGPLTMQFFYDGSTVSVGEVCGRFFGYGQGIVPIINGIDPNALLLNSVYSPDLNSEILHTAGDAFDHCSIALYLPPRHGIVKNIGNVMQFNNSNVDEFSVYVKPGVSTSYITWIVRVYAHFDTRDEADAYTRDVYEHLFVPGLNGENLVAQNSLVVYE